MLDGTVRLDGCPPKVVLIHAKLLWIYCPYGPSETSTRSSVNLRSLAKRVELISSPMKGEPANRCAERRTYPR